MSWASPVERLRFAVLASVLTSVASVAWSQESGKSQGEPTQRFDLSFSGGASYTDNIGRTAAEEESGNIGLLGLQLAYVQHSRRLESDVDVDVTWENYSDNTFEDDVIGGANAMFEFGIVPERFKWLLQENFGQIASNPFEADTPENREYINYLTTGPELLLNFGGDFSLRINARYSEIAFEKSDTGGSQYSGTLAFARELSSSSSLSLVVAGNSFEYDEDQLYTDYDRSEAYLHYEAKGRRTELSADLGYTMLDIADESPDGMLARLSITRRMSSASSLTAGFGTEFSDAGELFRDGQDLSGVSPDTSPVIGAGDPFRSDFGWLNFDYDRNRTSFGAGVRAENERYETETQLDRDLLTWSAYASRHLSAALELRIFAQLEQQEFQNVDFEDDNVDLGAYLKWNVGRRVSLRFQVDHFDRDSSDEDTNYDENRVSLRVIWSPVARGGQGPSE